MTEIWIGLRSRTLQIEKDGTRHDIFFAFQIYETIICDEQITTGG
jgi:hypothetical protein